MTMYGAETKNMTSAETRDDSEFYGAVMKHRDQLYGIAYSYLRNRGDALEAVQEAVCRAWIKRKTLRDGKAFKSWLMDKITEKDGYTIKVNAVAADRNELTVLYTAEVANDQELYNVSSVKVSDALTGSPLNFPGRFGSGAHAEGSNVKYYGRTTFVIGGFKQEKNREYAGFVRKRQHQFP